MFDSFFLTESKLRMLASPLSPHDVTGQLTTFRSYVALIADPTPGSKYNHTHIGSDRPGVYCTFQYYICAEVEKKEKTRGHQVL